MTNTTPTPEQRAALDRLAAYHATREADTAAPLARPRAAVYITPADAPETWQMAARNADPYAALEAVASLAEMVTRPPLALALVTHGTAAALIPGTTDPDPNTPRRRVILAHMIDADGRAASRVEFTDPAEVIHDTDGRGQIADALADALAALLTGGPR